MTDNKQKGNGSRNEKSQDGKESGGKGDDDQQSSSSSPSKVGQSNRN